MDKRTLFNPSTKIGPPFTDTEWGRGPSYRDDGSYQRR